MARHPRPMVLKPVVPLGNGATLYEEVRHFVHHMGNQLMELALRIEMRAIVRKERHQRTGRWASKVKR